MGFMLYKPVFILFVLVASELNVEATYYAELETLKPSQRETLQRLKNSVSPILPHDYMKEDIYLVKWLQVSNWSLRKAEQMLLESMKWRKENKLEEWENFSFFAEFEKDFPIYVDGYDRDGRPIMEGYFGDWNVRSVALQGKVKKLALYCLKYIERANAKIRLQQAQGRNVTQFNLLINMEGFNIINTACPACLPLYLAYMSGVEKNWPHTFFRTVLVNTPDTFEIALSLMRPIMSPQTRKGLIVFGSNKAEWKSYLDDLVAPSEVSEWFGGYKKRLPRD